ncbi:MAG: amidohydrolase [Proteobacteria bacterium]|nr:amidohydrolase [Pseudomonadota bacterium]
MLPPDALAKSGRPRVKRAGITFAVLAALLASLPAAALAQAEIQADIILRNGAVATMDPAHPSAQAIAIKGKQILAVGTDAEVDRAAGPATRLIDLAGRTVIPGLIDAHTHAIRGGQTFGFETYWFDAGSLDEALGRLSKAAAGRAADRWVAAVGGWHPLQFRERRAPTVAELSAAVPDHPAYVQCLYDYALVNARGIELLDLNGPQPRVPDGMTVERDAKGRATGKLTGNLAAYTVFFAQISQLGEAERTRNLQAFFGELNHFGITGVIDAFAGPAAVYDPLFALNDNGSLTVRTGYRVPAPRPGGEAEWLGAMMAFRPGRFTDRMVSFLGLGENLVFAMNDSVQLAPGFAPSAAARDELVKVATFAARKRIPLEIHAYSDDAGKAILDAFEAADKVHSIKGLRWTIDHLDTGTRPTFERMKALDIAYGVQMGPYFEAPAIRAAAGDQAALASPPTRIALDLGIPVAGGTDATRIGSYDVWHAIEYQVTGTAVGGVVQRRKDLAVTREEALKLYTANAAWLAFDEERRGTLEVGKLADIAVLDRPYFTVPAAQIHAIKSVLTIVDGKIVVDDLR